MFLRLSLGCTVTLLLASAPVFAADQKPLVTTHEIMTRLVEDVVRPGYHSFAETAVALDQSMQGFCKAPASASLAETQKSFAAAVEAWSMIEPITSGPVAQQNRLERVLFYPDTKGLALKQVQALLASTDAAAVAPGALEKKSVAVQGLTALEFVLSGTGSDAFADPKYAYRCQFGIAIADNLKTIATQIDAEWQKPDGIAKDWMNPGPDSAAFSTNGEALSALLGFLVHGLENVRDKRIAVFFEAADKPDFPKKAIYRRSENTLRSIHANLKGLYALWEQSHMKDKLTGDAAAIGSNIDFNFETALSTSQTLDQPVEKVLADAQLRGKLDFLQLTLKELQSLFNTDVGKAFGLGAGFSFSDGD